MVVGHGVQVPNSVGQFGGMPGACAYHLLRKSNAPIADLIEGHSHMHDLLDAGSGVQRFDSKPGHFPLHRGEVLAYSFQGGGGYGDPIRRDPERVARDVHNGRVTSHWASALYGAVLRDRARAAVRSAVSVLADARRRPTRPKATASRPCAPRSIKPSASVACAAPTSVRQPKAGSRARVAARCRRKPSARISRCTLSLSCVNSAATSAARSWKPKWRAAARTRSPVSCWTVRARYLVRPDLFRRSVFHLASKTQMPATSAGITIGAAAPTTPAAAAPWDRPPGAAGCGRRSARSRRAGPAARAWSRDWAVCPSTSP